jgi:hypothetical protein
MSTKRPDFICYTVRESGESKFWTRVGAAWSCKGGYSVQLDALPVNGKVVLQEPKADDQAA